MTYFFLKYGKEENIIENTIKVSFGSLEFHPSDGWQELLRQEVAGLTVGQENLKQAQIMTDIKMEKGQKSLQQQVTKTNIALENDIGRKISALFDAHQLDREKINHISETVEAINNAYAATDIVTRVNTAEINKLKTKIE